MEETVGFILGCWKGFHGTAITYRACKRPSSIQERGTKGSRVRMAEDDEWRGFGAPPPKPRRKSEGQKRREEAARSYDKMKAAGMPEYNVL